ncbi:uncharacterized protein L969DRAFT_421039 [Mixia osmundae IAM 14324]|uniref:Splicing factor U2AF subunit n=1 Tax=Mixia osmundae (strain CBS 9802 / IAM 14324 / JCM 22182 / KY 12970) TaxID=764103 RepID=G7DVE7_MIXOS|nr:uncharacterized protein L969DRAFT_421039 [Mixia osmundae IAM 14324]KEI40335.1 hypothetical protein L969DRAFT_421039 [Mixia osmundae IAM 14324]GAA94557.1 hypothetical protein E5Q_01209 [Mixia osmundae IAM 14324]
MDDGRGSYDSGRSHRRYDDYARSGEDDRSSSRYRSSRDDSRSAYSRSRDDDRYVVPTTSSSSSSRRDDYAPRSSTTATTTSASSDYRRRDYDDRPRHEDRPSRGGGYGGGYGGGGGRGGGRGGFGGNRRSPPREEVREKTPENTIPISKRRRAQTAWDVRPIGFETVSAETARMSGHFLLPGQNGVVRFPPGFHEGRGAFGGLNMSGAGSAAAPMGGVQPIISFARQQRRLYVGNIMPTADEQNVTEFFNAKMRENGLSLDDKKVDVQTADPVVSVQVNHEKSYAFVEFRSPEEASSAMSFDGIVFQDQQLKIRRPKDYTGDESGGTHLPGVISSNVPDTPNKVFVGGLPSYLDDEQVLELLSSFGELRSFNLVKEGPQNASKGFAFCEYADPNVTDAACAGLNGMEIGDRYLVVQRAQVGANVYKHPGGYGGSNPALPPALARVAPTIFGQDETAPATRCLQMLNMVTPEELVDDQDYADINEDIKDECSKYGEVIDVKIPRPIKTENGRMDVKASESVEHLGKIFVMFDSTESSKKAIDAIAGRQFGGRLVICAYEKEETFL